MEQTAIFGGGCFWCIEAVFQNLRGVVSVESGYAGGESPNPTYQSVSSGQTGHVEVVKIVYRPSEISYKDLLTIFFSSHDPTTLNRQGNDIGSQYRSVIIYTNEDQKIEAQNFIDQLNLVKEGGKIVTELIPFTNFYIAESYHQDYYNNNQDQPYCQLVINPKLEKIQKEFANLLKSHQK